MKTFSRTIVTRPIIVMMRSVITSIEPAASSASTLEEAYFQLTPINVPTTPAPKEKYDGME